MKGEFFAMRKIIKKVAAVAATLTMAFAMTATAFAEIEGEDYFSIAGDSHLFGVDEADNADFWVTVSEDLELPLVDTVESTNTVYSKKFTCASAGDYEFKILKDGADYGWSYQCCIGNPDSAWADNQTQFRATMEAGEYSVYVQPMTGFVCIIQNQKAAKIIVRYHSRDEDSANFVELTKAAIEADGHSDVKFDDAKYQEFVNACIVAEGGTPEETTTVADDTKKDDGTTVADDTKKDDGTTVADDTKKDDTKTETTKKASESKDDDGVNPVVIAVVVIVVVVVIVLAVVLSKKKKNN